MTVVLLGASQAVWIHSKAWVCFLLLHVDLGLGGKFSWQCKLCFICNLFLFFYIFFSFHLKKITWLIYLHFCCLLYLYLVTHVLTNECHWAKAICILNTALRCSTYFFILKINGLVLNWTWKECVWGFSAQRMCSCKDSEWIPLKVNSQQFVWITEATSPSAGSGDVLRGYRFRKEFYI